MVPAQVEKRIDPGVKIGRAAQTVTGAAIGGYVFARMMDERNGRARLALQEAEVSEQCGDLAGGVFIDRMKANQGIENEKNGTMEHERGFEALLIGSAVQTQRVGRNDANVQVRQMELVVV